MKVSFEDIEKAARVIKIDLSVSEKETLAGDAGLFVTWLETLFVVDTENVEPTFLIFDGVNVTGDNKQASSPNRKRVIKSSSNFSEGFYEVPSIIEEQGHS